ncbi:MAG: S1 RNA-binding domain-containing protein [Dehalococcoidia bacterium]|nr:S1 RNA-binding domain-containing protein [Dehalococcoidia bacterium]
MTTDPSSQPPTGTPDSFQDMATLLENESLQYRTLRRGDIIEGVVVGSDRDGMVIDVGTKSEGIIPSHEMQSAGPDPEKWPALGEHILVYVLQPETPEGQVLLSLDRARGEKGWRILQQRHDNGDSFEVQVSGYNKGGLLVNVEGVHAFIPYSQAITAQPPAEEEAEQKGTVSSLIGQTLLVKVIEINRARNRVILSERAAIQDWRALQKDRLLEELQDGEIRRGRISSIRSFGVFVDLGGADGLAHLSELSWERDKAPEELFKVGQEVDVYVMKVDPESKKIALSIRRAQPQQWEQIVDKYRVGQVVTGTVTKLVTFGAFARIEGPVEGLIHVSELVNRRITHPREVVKEGDIVPLKIVRVERDRQRLGLSLRQARDEAEEMGFVFGKNGEVLEVPEELAAAAMAQAGPAAPAVTEPVAEAPEAAVRESATETVEAVEEEVVAETIEAVEEETTVEAPEAAVEEAAAETVEEETAVAAAEAEEEVVAEAGEAVEEETAAGDVEAVEEEVVTDTVETVEEETVTDTVETVEEEAAAWTTEAVGQVEDTGEETAKTEVAEAEAEYETEAAPEPEQTEDGTAEES